VATTAATLAVCLAVCGASPSPKISEERVDLIEVNHFHDDQGRPVFDQILFYDWSPSDQRYQIRDWRLLKNTNQIPLRSTKDGDYVAVWSDFKSRDILRKTQAKLLRESWTQYDPELVERDFLPEGKRRKLQDASTSLKTASSTDARSANAAAPLRPLQTPAPR
jgi:hypothetical protein